MRSSFLFSPVDPSKTLPSSPDILHVSCLPYLCGKALPAKNPSGPKLLLSFPFVSKGRAYSLFCSRFAEFAACFDGFTLQNIGDFVTLEELFAADPSIRREDYFIAGDNAFNIANKTSAGFWRGKLDSVVISPELSREEQTELANGFPEGLLPEVIASGPVIAMRSEHCYAAEGPSYNCGKCGKFGLGGGSLFDIAGREFPVVTNPIDCNSVLLTRAEKLTWFDSASIIIRNG